MVDTTVDAVDATPGDGVCATSAGQCTLRAAVQESNALPGPDRVLLNAGRYALAIPAIGDEDEDAALRGDLDITDDVMLQGAGPGRTRVDGNRINRVFHVLAGATVDIRGLTITGGRFDSGAGIFNQGTLALSDAVVTRNPAAPLDRTVARFDEVGCKGD